MLEFDAVLRDCALVIRFGSCKVSYPLYIDRVYGTKVDPLSDGNPGIVCYDIFLLDLHPGI